MAKVVEDSVIASIGSKYAKYLDGQTWELLHGEDYESEASAKQCIYKAAYSRKLKVSVKRNQQRTGFYVRATPK